MKALKKISFLVIVNPFTMIAEVIHKDETIEIKFKEFDEWNAFNIGERVFDIHFHYDEEFTVSIYDVVNGNALTRGETNIKVKLKLQLSEDGKPFNVKNTGSY